MLGSADRESQTKPRWGLESLCGLLSLLLAAGLPPSTAAAELTPEEERGQVIYVKGESRSGAEIVALMGEMRTEVPAAVVPCVSCHGADGHGLAEAEVHPPDLIWAGLTEPHEHPGGRRHPPYDEELLKRAITKGIDPAGNRLHLAMPRYRLTLRDTADLIAYIRRLGEDPDPGAGEPLDQVAITTQPETRR